MRGKHLDLSCMFSHDKLDAFFIYLILNVKQCWNNFFQADVSSKTWTNEFYFTTMKPQFELLSFVFMRKLKTPKRHFQINCPLVKDCENVRIWECSLKNEFTPLCTFLTQIWPFPICFCYFQDEKTSFPGGGKENTVSAIVGGKTLYLFNLYDPDNPIELAFQSRYVKMLRNKLSTHKTFLLSP